MKRDDYEALNSHQALCIWFTGLSGSGKTTIAKALEEKLFHECVEAVRLDGDVLRGGICKDLGFTPEDRDENIRRAGALARLLFDYGHVVLCSFISPYRNRRGFVRSLFPINKFVEVYVKCPVEECRKRDPKGLYRKADSGEIEEFTGVSAPYEEPLNPEITVDTSKMSVEAAVKAVYDYTERLIDG
jgi:adenylyl-sulfate kinase